MDGTEQVSPGLLIDWLTLRIPIDDLGPALQERLFQNFDTVACFDTDCQAIKWESKRFNFDALRSDAQGLFFTVRHIKDRFWFYVGASPASLMNGCNVFGNLDIQDAAETLIARARVAFQSFLPMPDRWQCQRIDVTGNYALPDFAAVKLALRQLVGSDTSRRRASSCVKGGDTVLWSPESDLIAGKAYHKGPHLSYLVKSGKVEIPPEWVELAGRLLRLEMRLGAKWFRRLREGSRHLALSGSRGRDWLTLQPADLSAVFVGFFKGLVGGVEVTGMERVSLLERIRIANGLSAAAARSVHGTYKMIRDEGYEAAKASMSERTFYRHKAALLAADVAESELIAGNVLPFRPVRVMLAAPVASWSDLRRCAA